MHNLGTVVGFEFLRTIKKKSFWLSILAIPAVMVVVFSIIYFSNKSASETEWQTNTEKFSASVLDESGLIKQTVLDMIGAHLVKNRKDAIQAVMAGRLDSFIYYPPNPSSQTIEVFGQDVGLAKNNKYTNLARQLLKSSIMSELGSPEKAAILQKNPAAKLIVYSRGEPSRNLEQVFAPGVFLALFYLVIILLGNRMLTSTTEEKENRVIEIILTSVRAHSLIIGKILAMALVGALQVAVICLPVVIGLVFFRGKLNLPQVNLAELAIDPVRMLIGAILFILSFLLFTGLLVTIGAVVPTAKEAGSFFGIAVFFMFIPFYAFMAIIANPSQAIVKVFSFFPLTAPITLMLRNAVGNLEAMEAAAGITILAVSSLISLFIATRAFHYGTLEYERKLNLWRVFKG